MVGMTLVETRAAIEALASDDGEYYVVCGRTGDRPVPVAGERFDDRATARRAARATERYRRRLRRYDPRVPRHDPIVCQDGSAPGRADRRRERQSRDGSRALSEPVLDDASSIPNTNTGLEDTHPDSDRKRRGLVEFCHRATDAVFETLSGSGHESVESALMDAYLDRAGTVADPDDLCLEVLGQLATEVHTRLSPAQQAAVLATAATRMGPDSAEYGGEPGPLAATLAFLDRRGLVGSYTRSPWSVALADGTRSVVVGFSDYALSPREGRLPVLPVVLDLYRRRPARPPSSLRAADLGDGWRVTLTLADEGDPDGLASAPISEV